MRGWLVVTLVAACSGGEGDTVALTDGPGGTTVLDATHWSGAMTLTGSQQIGAGEAVVADPGTTITVAAGGSLIIVGSFTANGTAAAPVVFDAADGWSGIDVSGTLTGTYLQLLGRGGSLRAEDGAVVDLTDSEVDLMNPGGSPDCTGINGATLSLDHVRFHGCHCPLHINSAGPTVITNSIFDECAVQMVARLDATFTGNDISGGIEDIGGSITADVAGNYWGGGAPNVQSTHPEQFTGTDDWSDTPIPGAGPR